MTDDAKDQAIERVREALIAVRRVPNQPLGTGFLVKEGDPCSSVDNDVYLWLDDVLWLLNAYDRAIGKPLDGRLFGDHLIPKSRAREYFHG